MTASNMAGTPYALTGGAPGSDFTLVSGGTCSANVSYLAGQQCTVAVQFAPTAAGLRTGAVVLTALDGSKMATATLAGMGVGGLPVLVPGQIDTVAGNGAWIYHGDGVPATQAPIFLPTAIIADGAGNLFLSDSSNNRIRRVDAQTGLIATIAGTGTPGFSGDGGPASYAAISSPSGLVMDGAGDLFFADSGNHVIRRIDAISGIITTIAGVPGSQGYSGDGLAATAAQLTLPQGLAFDARQTLYIADTGNNVVRAVNPVTGVIRTVAGTGVAGFNGDNRSATGAQLNTPWNIAFGTDGSLYIADLNNNRVRKVDSSGNISTVAGSGVRGFAGDGSPAQNAELEGPAALAFDPAGNFYIADSGNNRVRRVNASDGTIQTIAGNDSEQFAGDAGPANAASLYGPYALFLDQSGNLFVADMFHNRVRRISATSIALQYSTIRVGNVSPPQPEGFENDGNAAMTLTPIVLNNAALDPVTTTCAAGSAMAPDSPCNLGVEFAPTAIGVNVTGSVTLTPAGGGGPAVVNVSGQVLSVNPTAVALTSGSNPSVVGNAVTFNATVASAGTALTGTVVFLDGSTTLCSVALGAGGSAVCSTSTLALGSHTITARYSGDSDDASSVSGALQQIVKQSPSVSLVVSPNPAIVTGTVAFSVTVTAPTGTPTGTVTFFDGTSPIGSANLNASGVANFSTTQLAAASHALSVAYAGDSLNAAAQSNVVNETVQLAATSTALAASTTSIAVGINITFTSIVTSSNGPVPTGTVAFSDGTATLGTATLNTSGIAVLSTSSLTPGAHNIVATYSGDSGNATSTSMTVVVTIQQIATATALISDLNPANSGASIDFKASVAMVAGSAADGPVTGAVIFSDGATVLGMGTLDINGNAILTVNTLAVGPHTITAAYGGNTNYAPSTSSALVESVNLTGTVTVLASSASSSLAGNAVVFTATVSSAAATPTGTPTGAVVFNDGSIYLGQGTLNTQGIASVTASSLTVGSHRLTAVYSGDVNYHGSTSAPMLQTVSLATISLSIAGPSTPVDAGTTLSLTGTLSSNGIAPTGALMLKDGAATIATQNVSAGGSFTFTTSTLALGAHTLSVSYTGDGHDAAAVSNSLAVVIQQAATTTSLTTSMNPSIVGQAITFTSTVSSSSAGVAGTVTFQDGSAALGSVPLSANGTATFATAGLAFGPHAISAVYSGDTNHAGSSSPAIGEQIVQAATAVLTSAPNPSTSGTNAVFSVHIGGVGALIPTGTATFSDGANALGVVTLDAAGNGALQTSALAVGSHSISAAYSGDANYAVSSTALIQTVVSANTQITLSGGANPAIYGASLSLTAAIASNGGIATGTVTFTDGGSAIGNSLLNSNGVAVLTLSTLSPGSHTIVANYAGDGKAGASASTPLLVTVSQLTSTTLASNTNPTSTLSAVVLIAAVANSGAGQATGIVTFNDGGTQLGTAALDATGRATLTVPSLSAGNHSFQALYGGDSTDFPSTSAILTEGVQLRSTATALSASQTNAGNTQQVTLIGVVRSTGPVAPTGVITFTSGATVVGSGSIDATGVATLTIFLQNNTQNIVASYGGDAAYAASSSLATTVSGGVATQFTFQISPTSITLQSKQRSTVNLSLVSLNGFADTLQFGCAGLPSAATCTFSKPQVALAANGSGTIQLTVDTGDPLGAGSEASVVRRGNSTALLCFVPGTFLLGIVFVRRRRLGLPRLLLTLLAVGTILGASGCNGLSINGTPPGTYAFKVVVSGQGTGATQTQDVTLTVTQ